MSDAGGDHVGPYPSRFRNGAHVCSGCVHLRENVKWLKCGMTNNPLPEMSVIVTPTWCPLLPKDPCSILRQCTEAAKAKAKP